MGHSVEHEKKALKKSNGVIKKSQRLNKWLFLLSYRFYDRIYWGQVKKTQILRHVMGFNPTVLEKHRILRWVLSCSTLQNCCCTATPRRGNTKKNEEKDEDNESFNLRRHTGNLRNFCKKYLHAAAKEFELLCSLFFVFEQFCVHFRVNFHYRVRFSNLTIFMLQVFEQSRNTSSWWLSG